MTIASYTNKTTGTLGTGTIGQEISFTFPVFDESEVVVIARLTSTGDDTPLTETTHYTVALTGSGTPNYTGGAITMTVATYDNTYTIYIYRVTTQSQATDLIENDNLPAESTEGRLDMLTCQIADLAEIVGRCIKVPLADGEVTGLEVGNEVDRASTTLGFDADGNVTTT